MRATPRKMQTASKQQQQQPRSPAACTPCIQMAQLSFNRTARVDNGTSYYVVVLSSERSDSIEIGHPVAQSQSVAER